MAASESASAETLDFVNRGDGEDLDGQDGWSTLESFGGIEGFRISHEAGKLLQKNCPRKVRSVVFVEER